jgi:FixJ family two-component response regulator/predicted Ser/Thr protein kinase
MRFLIVDESSEQRGALAALLQKRWPGATVDAWDPGQRGNPGAEIARERYDAVLLDSRPGGDDGIGWVADIRRLANAPPLILLTEQGGEALAVKAMKAGAADFLRKSTVTAEQLARSIEDAMREREARRADAAGGGSTLLKTQRLDLRAIGTPVEGEPDQVPGYRTLRKIGEGGMGQVYLAERVHDGLQLVLKLLDPELRRNQTFFKRFVREYKLIAALESEHVARIYDQGFAGTRPYIAMEYLSRGTLAVRMHEGLSSLAALRIVSQIAKALDAIHSRNVVHRDLKPQNIMFRDNGRPVIVDFGLARDLESDANLTRAGELLATPRYMSPEQCLGKPADHRSDLYSLGAIFYEMLAGKRLFGDAGPAELSYLHVHGKVPRLPKRLAGYQPIVDRLLAKDPEARYQSARELFAAIAI